MLKKSLHRIVVALLLIAFTMFGIVGCAKKSGSEKTSIVFGAARSQSGVYAFFDQNAFGPIYRMWADQVNANGGIYVKELDKKLPVELKIYDDTSDLGTMTRMYEKLMLEDKVDFILPPVSTAFLNAVAPIANRNGYILIGAEGGSETLKDAIDQNPYFFSTLNYSETQIPALVDVLKEKNVTSVYIVYIEDQHGLEYHDAAVPAFEAAGIEIKGNKSIPLDIQDMTPILNDAKNSGAQAYLMFAYPDQNFLAINQAMSIAYNPDVFLIGPGGSFDSILGVFGGAGAVEGLMSWGAWNEASSQSAADFVTTFKAAFPDIGIDWWGHLPYLTSLQVLQQAIEKAGTLDQAKIRDIIATEKFDTVMGEVWFESNLLAAECYLGQVGQWQNGVFQVIDVGENRTADPIVPKPAWPEPAA